MRIKKGDIVVDRKCPDNVWKIYDVDSSNMKMGQIDNIENGAWFNSDFIEDNYIPEEIYNSPLAKALREEE